MRHEIRLDYRARPSALAFVARAVRPSPGLKRGGVPAIAANWHHRPAAAEVVRFHALSGLAEGEALPLLYPHTIAFPLHMAILTQPAFPLPIWRMLQVRNRIVQHAPLLRAAEQAIGVRLVGHRVLDKGVEFDLHATVRADGVLAWESLNTFYARGRFGAPMAGEVPEAPKVSPGDTAQWRMPAGGGWQYGGLSGDYNPLHLWSGYARKHGFARAFFHPQRVLGQCLARLEPPAAGLPLRLDAWLKGPVFYGAPVRMRRESGSDGCRFALHVNEDERPAIVGHLRPSSESIL
ncbi:MAG: acyl dehydratase [Betaproteobacteria bacterium]|nr:acyl dehydratase [Betaproteobacteria bacterium]